jgi:hypothetical protein
VSAGLWRFGSIIVDSTHHGHPGIVVHIYSAEAGLLLDERVGTSGAKCAVSVLVFDVYYLRSYAIDRFTLAR